MSYEDAFAFFAWGSRISTGTLKRVEEPEFCQRLYDLAERVSKEAARG